MRELITWHHTHVVMPGTRWIWCQFTGARQNIPAPNFSENLICPNQVCDLLQQFHCQQRTWHVFNIPFYRNLATKSGRHCRGFRRGGPSSDFKNYFLQAQIDFHQTPLKTNSRSSPREIGENQTEVRECQQKGPRHTGPQLYGALVLRGVRARTDHYLGQGNPFSPGMSCFLAPSEGAMCHNTPSPWGRNVGLCCHTAPTLRSNIPVAD